MREPADRLGECLPILYIFQYDDLYLSFIDASRINYWLRLISPLFDICIGGLVRLKCAGVSTKGDIAGEDGVRLYLLNVNLGG